MLKRTVFVAFSSSLFACGSSKPPPAAEPTPELVKAAPMSAAALERRVRWLSDDSFAGRHGFEEDRHGVGKAIAGVMRDIGLRPLPNQERFLLPFEVRQLALDTKSSITVGDMKLGAAKDFRTVHFYDDFVVSDAAVVFAGDGTKESFEQTGVKGAVVVVRAGNIESQVALAVAGGAVAVLVAGPANTENKNLRSEGRVVLAGNDIEEKRRRSRHPIAVLELRPSAADQLSRALWGADLSELAKPARADGLISIEVTGFGSPAQRRAFNVAGTIPGSDPVLSKEWIVVGAHYDHLGDRGGPSDRIFNGANDNATGVAMLLALAQELSARGPLKRSVAFVCLGAEEIHPGFLGSKWFLKEQTLPVDDIAFMVNFDMLGGHPERSIEAFGRSEVEGLGDFLDGLLAQRPGLIEPKDEMRLGSDHGEFMIAGIPVLYFHSPATETNHRENDHADGLDYEQMERFAHFGIELLVALSDRRERFVLGTTRVFRGSARVEWLGAEFETHRTTFGTVLKRTPKSVRARITKVTPYSQAARAGLAVGLEFPVFPLSNKELDVEEGARLRLVAADGTVHEVERRAAAALAVTPGKARKGAPLGIVVGRVAGAAQRAKIRRGDIITKIGDVPVSTWSLKRRLAEIGTGQTVPVEVYRKGKTISLKVLF